MIRTASDLLRCTNSCSPQNLMGRKLTDMNRALLALVGNVIDRQGLTRSDIADSRSGTTDDE